MTVALVVGRSTIHGPMVPEDRPASVGPGRHLIAVELPLVFDSVHARSDRPLGHDDRAGELSVTRRIGADLREHVLLIALEGESAYGEDERQLVSNKCAILSLVVQAHRCKGARQAGRDCIRGTPCKSQSESQRTYTERNLRRILVVTRNEVTPVRRDRDVHDLVDEAVPCKLAGAIHSSSTPRTHPWWNCTGMGVASLLAFS